MADNIKGCTDDECKKESCEGCEKTRKICMKI